MPKLTGDFILDETVPWAMEGTIKEENAILLSGLSNETRFSSSPK